MADQCDRVIRSLEDHSSRINKEAIVLVQAQEGNTEFFDGCKLALDSMITFGVKKIPKHCGIDGPGLSWLKFCKLADNLATRNLTGHAASNAILDALHSSTKNQWNDWYSRILAKDLRAGFSESTINKVVEKKFPQFAIQVFACQLAFDSANHEGKVSGKKIIEEKLDGVRVLAIVHPNGTVNLHSRNGKALVNFPIIEDQLRNVAHNLTEPAVFDGEVMSGTFQDLMKQIHRKGDEKAVDAVLHLFDMIPLTDFQKGKWDCKQTERSAKLKAWKELWEKETPNIEVVGQEIVDLDSVAGQKRYTELNKKAIAAGREGIMMKELGAGYVCKRSTAWMKLKPFIEVTLEVQDVEEGTGKNLGRMGALVCSGQDDGKVIAVNVGGGFSDKLRDDIWGDRNNVRGQFVEVRADAITQNQDGTYSLRFPRFKTFRGFAVGEKL